MPFWRNNASDTRDPSSRSSLLSQTGKLRRSCIHIHAYATRNWRSSSSTSEPNGQGVAPFLDAATYQFTLPSSSHHSGDYRFRTKHSLRYLLLVIVPVQLVMSMLIIARAKWRQKHTLCFIKTTSTRKSLHSRSSLRATTQEERTTSRLVLTLCS